MLLALSASLLEIVISIHITSHIVVVIFLRRPIIVIVWSIVVLWLVWVIEWRVIGVDHGHLLVGILIESWLTHTHVHLHRHLLHAVHLLLREGLALHHIWLEHHVVIGVELVVVIVSLSRTRVWLISCILVVVIHVIVVVWYILLVLRVAWIIWAMWRRNDGLIFFRM